MNDHDVLVGQMAEQYSLLSDWMVGRKLHDVEAEDFALTSRTKRLRVQGSEGSNEPKSNPFVMAVIIPPLPGRNLWQASDMSIFKWLQDPARRYAPFPNRKMLPSNIRGMPNGIVLEDPDHRNGEHTGHYLAFERNGVIEMGLGVPACIFLEQRKGFFLTTIVAHVWHLLGLTCDFFSTNKQDQPFTLILNLRATKGAMLAGFASGWREPWGPDGYGGPCRESHVQIIHRLINPHIGIDSARNLAREIAFEIELAWGFGGVDLFPRCFQRLENGKEGEFDLSACR